MNGGKNISGPDDLGRIRDAARQIRRQAVRMSHRAGAAHLGSALSCADILAAAYYGALNVDPENPSHPGRDRFILSKGHAVAALYAALGHRAFFPLELLDAFNTDGAALAEHPLPSCAPGVEFAAGSLGHGLSVGLGMAAAAKLAPDRPPYRVYVLLSDGECNEGSVWESALFAPAYGLDNVMAIVDYNRWQATDRSENVLALKPLKDKWAAFGWSVYEADGHDAAGLVPLMRNLPDGSGKPAAVIAHTVKGKGVSFMEDDNNWHYRIPSEEETEAALRELA